MTYPRSHMHPCKYAGKQVTRPNGSFQVRVVPQLAEHQASPCLRKKKKATEWRGDFSLPSLPRKDPTFPFH